MTRSRVWASLGIRPESVGNPPGIRWESARNPLGIRPESVGNPPGIRWESVQPGTIILID